MSRIKNKSTDITKKKSHVCKESHDCCCSISSLDPDEKCPVHGGGEWPPRCQSCGKFMKKIYQ
jgi:hypothetical protein